jgi:tetratricopeptide (TPR) repeat protein/TolB-like protein
MKNLTLFLWHCMPKFNVLSHVLLISICLLFLLCSTGFTFQEEKTSQVQVGIINFLYLHDNGYESKNNSNHAIETSVLFPSLENEIKQYGMSNYSIRFEKVMNGNLEYSESFDQLSDRYTNNGNGYDLNVWGLVKPINWTIHYDLDLVLFIDSHFFVRSHIKVRNKRIIQWDGKKCNLSQETLGVLPGAISYALAQQKGQNSADQISKRLEKLPKAIQGKMIQLIQNLTPQRLVALNNEVGTVQFVYESGLDHRVSIDQSTYDQLQRFLSTNKSYNWYLDQGGLLMPEISIVLGSPDREISTQDFEMSYAEPRTPAQLQVGIIPFENNSGTSKYDWVGFGFEYLLSNKFSHIPHYKLAESSAVLKFINSDSASVHVNGEEWSLNYSIGGKYKIDDKNMEIDLTYIKPFAGTQLASEHYLTDYDDFFSIVDNAATKFLRVTGIVLSDTETKIFNRKVTSSMKAFENFCMGYLENASPDRDEEQVIRYFLAAIEEDPEFWGAYYNLGTTYYNREEYTSALARFNFIITHFPSFELAYLGRGLTYFQQKKFNNAKSDFQTYSKHKPNDFRAYYYLGRVSNQLRKYADAIKNLNRAIELNPNYGKNYFELGNVFYAMNRYRPAISQYQLALKLEPAHLEMHKRLGESYYRMHNFSGAINEFKVVLAENPDDGESNFMMGVTVYKQALLDEYIDAFLEMYGLLNTEEIASNKVKHEKEQIGVYKEMTKRFYLAQKSRVNFYEATFNLALTYQERGIPDSAFIFYNKTLQLKPNLTKARVVLAKFYEKQDEIDKALDEYKVVVRTDPGYFVGYPNLGPLYDDMDILTVVIEELEIEVKADPHNIDASLSLANIYHTQGYNGKAAIIYRRVLSLYPEHKKAKTMLARINGDD